MSTAPIVVDTSGASSPGDGGAGVSLAQYRRLIADELGLWQATTITETASGGELVRFAIADEFRDDDASPDTFFHHYLYVADGPQAGAQRRILAEGYDGPTGVFRVTRPFAAPLAPGTRVELTHPLPIRRLLGVKGLNTVVDEALARIWIEARIPLMGSAGGWVNLTDYDALVSYEQTRGLYDWRCGGADEPSGLSRTRYRFGRNGAGTWLEGRYGPLDYGIDEAFQLAVLAQADRVIHDGSGWTYRDEAGAGLSDHDDWRAAAPSRWVLAFGMVKALRQVRKLLTEARGIATDERRGRLADTDERLVHWARAAVRIATYEFPAPIQEPTSPMLGYAGAYQRSL
jgi:hypothetical protein